jgi:Na+-driven multidrug efflux pump
MEAAGHFVERRKSMQTNNKMAVVPVGKLIWQMSIPPLISMFLQYSYNLIDSAFVARLSENALTAVSLSFPITTLMNAASIWIGVGVNVLIAGYLGQKKQMIYRIFAFGLPSFIMNALSSFVVTFVNLFLVAYSDTAIAFFGAYFKVQQLIVMTVNGLIQGCLPVMRFNYGAGNSERLHSAFRYGTVLVTGMMILGTLAVLLFPAQILELFTASEAMRSFGISAMRIMAASYLFCGLSTMISTYFQTTEKVGSSMAIQLCRQMLFLVPALWCLDKLFQLNGIWLAFPVAETATLLVALVMMAWHRRKNTVDHLLFQMKVFDFHLHFLLFAQQ